jgi:hypothetical protein
MSQPVRLTLGAFVLAVLVAGATPLGQAAMRSKVKSVPLAKVALFAHNAGKLSGHTASSNPRSGQIPLVGASGKLPASIIPAGSTSSPGGGGTAGPAGPTGPTGATGATGPAGAVSAVSGFHNTAIAIPTTYANGGQASLSIPSAGSWVIFAKGYVVDTASTWSDVACNLSAGADLDTSETSLTGTNKPNVEVASLALNIVHNFTGAGTAIVSCAATSTGDELHWLKITAIQVSSLANNGI